MVLTSFILSLNTQQNSVVTPTVKIIESIADLDPIQVAYGTVFGDLSLPATVEATFDDDSTGPVSINWIPDNYDENVSGVVTLVGTLVETDTITNPDSLTASIDVDVFRTLAVSEGYIEFTGAQSLCGYAVMAEFTCHFYRERMLYHNGKTYFIYGHSYQHKPYSQAKMLVHDTQRGVDRPVNVGSVLTVTDTHNVPAIGIANDRLNIIQEPVHDTPMRQTINTTLESFDYTIFNTLGTIGAEMSYCHLIEKADGNFAIWHRGYNSPDTGFYSIWVAEASAGMTSWSAQRQITQKSATAGERDYPFLPFARYKANGRIYVGWSSRQDTNSIFWRNHIAWTPDSGADCLRVFTNIEETYTHDVDVDGPITDAEGAANFAFMTMSNNTIQGGIGMCTISPTGKFYAIVPAEPGGGSGALFLKYYDDVAEEWVTKPLTVPSGVESNSTTYSAMYLMAFSDNDIWYAERFIHGSFSKHHFVRTTDQGDTWQDLGDMNPDITDKSLNFLFVGNPFDIPANTNFPLIFAYQDGSTDLARLVVRMAAWGTLQATPGVPVVAASSMNYAGTGLFHYKCIDSAMTRTGTAVNTLIDQFGIRDATTGTNKPVWNNVDSVALTAASSHRFIPGTPASLVNKGALTFLCVAKSVGAEFILLNFSLTSATNKYYEVTLNTNVLRLRMTNTSTHFSDSQDTINDGNFHVFAIVTNGVNTAHMYVDGKRQYFTVNLNDVSGDTLWDDIGTGPLNVGANIVHIGFRDLSSGDAYSSGEFKEMALFAGAMPNSEVQARIKMLCDNYGITYRGAEQFQIPTL